MTAMLGTVHPFYNYSNPRSFRGGERTYLEPEPTEKTKEDYIRIAKAQAKRLRRAKIT